MARHELLDSNADVLVQERPPGPYTHKIHGPKGLTDVVHSVAQNVTVEIVTDPKTDKVVKAFAAMAFFVRNNDVGVYATYDADGAERLSKAFASVAKTIREIEETGKVPSDFRDK